MSEKVTHNRIMCPGPFRIFIENTDSWVQLRWNQKPDPGVPCMVVDPISPADDPTGGEGEGDGDGKKG